jgi:hypothetical protein
MNLDLHVVETLEVQTCPHCNTKYELATVRRTLEESQRAARERDALETAHRKAVSASQGAGATPAGNSSPAGSPEAQRGPQNVIAIDPEKRAADLRSKARMSNDDTEPPPVQAPRINYAGAGTDGESISQFNRRVDAAYRGL